MKNKSTCVSADKIVNTEWNYLQAQYYILGEKKSCFLQENFIHDISQIKILTEIPVYKQINEALQNYIDMMFDKIRQGKY